MSKKSLLIIIIFFLILSLFATVFLVLRTTVFYQKAATSNSAPVTLENSYLFASPIQAKADGKEQIRITVFLLDGRGIGVPNQTVTLNLPSTIKIQSITDLSVVASAKTDDSGKAIFDLSTTSPNTYTITAKTDNKEIPQKVRVVFY